MQFSDVACNTRKWLIFLVSVIVLTIIPLLQHVIKLKFSVVNLVHYTIILSSY